jgi:hypothetical protein
MKNRLVLVAITAVLFAAPHEAMSAASQPYSGRSNAPIQADAPPANPQKDQAASPYTKQPTQAPPQQAAPMQKLSPAVPLTKQPAQPETAVAQRKIEEAKLVSVQPGPAQWISWGYLRAYQPETLGRILGDVNTGRLPRTAVAGVVPAAQLETLLKNTGQPAGNAAAERSLPSSAITQKSSTQDGGVAIKPNTGAVKTAPSSGAEFMPALRSLPFRTTPDRLEFGTLMLGQVQYKTVRFVAPLNGEARVSISDPAFRIRRLRSLNGTFSLQTVPVALATGATIQSVNAVANVSQQRTVPPWTIPVRSGEDVEITIDVSRSPNVTLGEHAAQLRIDLSNSPGALVPVHARLDGRLYGIGINVDGNFQVLLGRDFMLPFEWLNEGEPSEATLTLDNPPPGFSTATPVQTIKLGKGERRSGAFVINVSSALIKNDSYIPATLNLSLVNGPIRITYGIDVLGYPPWLKKSVNARSRFDDGETVDVYGMMQIRGDGWFQFEGKISTSTTRSATVVTSIYRYDVGMPLPGGFNHTVHGSFGKGTFASTGSRSSSWSESGNSPLLANNFIAAASGLQRAAMNPYIKVTRSAF